MFSFIVFLYIFGFVILKSADKSINFKFLFLLKFLLINFCASPFGKDKKY